MKFFVSYCSADAQDIGIGIKKHLERVFRAEVFLSEIDIHAGDEWDKKIENKLKNCDFFLIIVTPGVFSSEYIKNKEIPKAIELGIRIIPCRDSKISREKMNALRLKGRHDIEFDHRAELLRKLVPEIKPKGLLNDFDEIDQEVPKMKAYANGGSPSDYSAAVVAESEGGTMIFRDVNTGKPRRIISRAQFRSLDAQSYRLLVTYERSLLKGFRQWRIEYNKGNYYTSRKTRDKVRLLVHGICSDWQKIISHLGLLNIRLDDHYIEIYDICRDYGYVETRTRRKT